MSEGWSVPWMPTTPPPGQYTFHDVPPGAPFFDVIETAAASSIISGYTCGGPGEPCDAQHRPYFRQYNNATRGQIAKIVYLGLTGPATCPPPPVGSGR